MIRIQLFSELHHGFKPTKPVHIRDDVDLVVVPGDVAEVARNAFRVLRAIVPEGNRGDLRRAMPDLIAICAPGFARCINGVESEIAASAPNHRSRTIVLQVRIAKSDSRRTTTLDGV